MQILVFVLIFIVSLLLILVVLIQNPKGGLAANFSSNNQVMGVRRTTDFLEKATWTLAIALMVLSIMSSLMFSNNGTEVVTPQSELSTEANEVVIPQQQAPMIQENIPQPGEQATPVQEEQTTEE